MTSVLLLLAGTASAFEYIAVCDEGPTRWTDLPTVWQLDLSNGQAYTGLTDNQVLDAVQAGFDVWTNTTTCCSGFQHIDGGFTTAGAEDNDGVNAIYFEEVELDPVFGESTIAITRVSWTSRCRIRSVDQTYNAVGFTFTVTNVADDVLTDLQSIAAHENGHWLGLDHSSVRAATMWFGYSPGSRGPRTLDPDDEAGVCASHPCGEFDCSNGIDDEGDGATDCDDPDCIGVIDCSCPIEDVLDCDVPVTDTTEGARNTVEFWYCSYSQTDGPDRTYSFVSEEAGPVTLELTGLSADLDLIVADEVEGGCDSNSCLASVNSETDDESLTFEAEAGVEYTVVVDGFLGAASDYTLRATCPEPPPACTTDERRIRCGRTRQGDTTELRNLIEEWSCTGRQTTGPEETFQFVADDDARVTFTVRGLEADLDLVVTPEVDGACEAGECAASTNPGTARESVTVDVAAGDSLAVVVDGIDGATSTYRIDAECAPLPEPEVVEEISALCEGCNGSGELAWLGLPLTLLLLRRRRARGLTRR